VRSATKASSAGSTSGQAVRRGSTRRASVAVVLVALAAALALSAASASAAITRLPLGAFGEVAQPSFGSARGLAVDQSTGDLLVIDAAAGTVSRYHADGTPDDFTALGTNVIDGAGGGDKTPQEGLSFGGARETQIAVDNSGGANDGNIYVAQPGAHSIDIFSDAGNYLGQLTAAGAEPFGEACGVAVDSSGAVFVGDYRGEIHRFAPAANPPANSDNTASFTTVAHPCTLAAGSGATSGSLFATNYEGAVSKLNATTGAPQYVVEEGSNTTVTVDPGSGHVFVAKENKVLEYDASGPTKATLETTVSLPSAAEGVAVDETSGRLYVASSGDPNIEVFGPKASVPGAPVIESELVESVTFEEAVIATSINPEDSPTSYRVEYGADSSYGQSTSSQGVGADETVHRLSVNLKGLAPGATYHWRVVATNGLGTTVSPDHEFRTFRRPVATTACANQAFRTGASANLADCRAYEMVSPVDKNNTDIVSLININSILAVLDQAAPGGEKLTYTTSQGFGDAQGVPYVTQYIASRDPLTGWQSHGITPPQGVSGVEIGQRIDIEFRSFTSDLCSSVLLNATDPPLAPGAIEGFQNLYRRQNCGSESYEALSTATPPPGAFVDLYTPHVQGTSDDGSCTVLQVQGEVFESCGGQLQELSVLPNGIPSKGTAGTSNVGVPPRSGTVENAVSADGSRVYWTSNTRGAGSLYLRENPDQPESSGECEESGKACTITVHQSLTTQGARFWSASSDGEKALYSIEDPESLLINENLYEFDRASKSSSLIAGKIFGLVGASDDADVVSFVSQEVLGAEVNSEAKMPTEGEPNLYLFDSTKTGADRYHFVGTMSARDAQFNAGERLSPLGLQPYTRTSRVSPDGRQVVFLSTASLTGYDNTDRKSGNEDAEVFAYDASAAGGEGALRCVSCNPSGQRPSGRPLAIEEIPTDVWAAALLPTYATELYGSRVISDDGKRVFFDSYEALLPSDTNGKTDVYQWEAPGSGDCREDSPAYSPVNQGCLSLISSGQSPVDSAFVDASADGRDVFFTTASSLLAQDPGLIDIYDARAGGGYPPPAGSPAPCEGEACQSPPAPPNDPTPASAAFNGAGNAHAKARARCAKGKARRHKRCVAKKHQHKAKRAHQRAADNDRRAAR
jgi:hypothetical protein